MSTENTGKWVHVVSEYGEPVPAIGDNLVPAHWIGTDLLPEGTKAKGRALSGARAVAADADAEAKAAAERAEAEAAEAKAAAEKAAADAKNDAKS